MTHSTATSSFENRLEQQENINSCGICKKEKTSEKISLNRFQRDDYWDTWIQCDVCFLWFHSKCVNVEDYEVLLIKKFYCTQCAVSFGPSQMKEYVCNHRYAFNNKNELDKPIQIGTEAFIKNFEKISSDILEVTEEVVPVFKDGHDFIKKFDYSAEWKLPYKIINSDGLGMKMPAIDFDINDIVKLLGQEIVVEAIDVYSQHIYLMSLGRFEKLWKEKNRKRLYNILSLEFSNTPLSEFVKSPMLVRKLSWVEKFWPNSSCKKNDNSKNWTGLKKKNPSNKITQEEPTMTKPCVDNFCLLGMKNSYTDFHIDFGGSSVWYHVFRGKKIFYLAEPTEHNLTLFTKYQAMPNQSEIFFGDFLPKNELKKLTIEESETLLIPSGWIHAVWTSVDSIVFGGNFLHSLNITMQLRIYEMEELSEIDDRFKFPYFELTNCYAMQAGILEILKEANEDQYIIPLHLKLGIEKIIFYMTKWLKEQKNEAMKFFRKTLKELEKEFNKQKRIKQKFSSSIDISEAESESLLTAKDYNRLSPSTKIKFRRSQSNLSFKKVRNKFKLEFNKKATTSFKSNQKDYNKFVFKNKIIQKRQIKLTSKAKNHNENFCLDQKEESQLIMTSLALEKKRNLN